ncbi:MAG: heme exporter protein CcmD [Cohaesibacteraceae bacterium]
MVIDQHFGFIAFSWLAGIIGFAGIGLWIWRDRKALDKQLDKLEADLPTEASDRRGG